MITKPTTIKHISEYLNGLQDIFIARKDQPELSLLSLPELNRKMWGIRPGRMTIIAARTSVGKSAFAMQIGWDLASQGVPVLFMSLEMSVEELIERLFCHVYYIDNFELLSGKFEQYKTQWQEFKDMLGASSLVITDAMGKTWKEIDAYVSGLDHKPKVILMDYIQTIAKSSGMKEEIDEYIRHFREMAVRHHFAGIICSQINRSSQENDNKEPQLHQLKGSGGLEELMDVGILLHWPHRYNEKADKSDYTIFLAKNRNGRTGYFNVKFYPQYYRFQEQVMEVAKEIKRADWDETE